MGLNGIEVVTSKPCSQEWAAMTGDGRARHCAACDKTVHNLARMPAKDVERLALRAAMGEEVCARITRRVDGELVMLEGRGGGFVGKAAGVVMAAVVAVGSAAAQGPSNGGEDSLPRCEPLPNPIGVVSGCWKPQPPATLTGRVLRPDGSPVSSGLLLVRGGANGGTLYVLDEIGTFEIHEEPGTYELLLQTAEHEARRIGAVQLHEGYQSFGDVKTGTVAEGLVEETYGTMGTMMSTITTRFGWKNRFRHPVLYAKAVWRSL